MASSMSLALKADQPAFKGVQRIARKRIDKALQILQKLTLAGDTLDDAAIHEARKRFKEIRGVLRVARRQLGRKVYRRENREFRDAGRPLSELRDSSVLIQLLDRLVLQSCGRFEPVEATGLRTELLQRRRDLQLRLLRADCVPSLIRSLEAAKRRAARWHARDRHWNALIAGLRQVYSEGRTAMRASASAASASTASLHEWRKRTKSLHYALELLQCLRPRRLKPLLKRAQELTNLLGDDHDLAVLRQLACAQVDAAAVPRARLLEQIDHRRSQLQRRARLLGGKLFRERSQRFVSRLQGR